MKRATAILTALLACAAAQFLSREAAAGENPVAVFQTDVPAYAGNVILGRPTDRSVTASVLVMKDARARIVYGAQGGTQDSSTAVFELKAGEPREVELGALHGDAAWEYRLIDADSGQPLLDAGGRGTFRTCRARGSSFTFTVTADPHLDEFTDSALYRRTMESIRAESPDFHIDLGDTFMTGKHADRESAARQYAAQRYWFGLIGRTTPLFLVIGNHDGEEDFRPGAADAGGLAVWSNTQRKRYFPDPTPSAFYSGNSAPQPNAGLLQDYFAWEWGDALFVALDPYWHSGFTRGGREPWSMSLGKAQYEWLSRTLRGSKARFKFVFIHQLVGGLDAGARGGAEAAALYEWGGRNAEGRDEFAARRPGWEMPIHRLLVETGVQIVFHGHDHFFARQELDGVVYQLVPQPAHRNFRNHTAAEYGYRSGDFLPNSGHLRVSVTPERTTVDYVRTADDRMGRQGVVNGRTALTYGCDATGTAERR